jgi:hypothetical protein
MRVTARGLASILMLAALLAIVPSAAAAGDPVASGSLRLKTSGSLKKQLKRSHATMSPKALTIDKGTLDPTTGSGQLSFKGSLRFKHGQKKVVYRKLSATLGAGGVLKSGTTPLFGLRGGTLTRDGFGAQISSAKLTLRRSAAKKLSRKLGLPSLRAGSAGSASVAAQPQTVQIVSGSATLAPYLPNHAGSVAAKLGAHCVNSASGVTPIAPATEPAGVTTPFVFPVTGGTISPDGADGTIQQSGGLKLVSVTGGPGVSPHCNTITPAQLTETDFAYDLLQKTVLSHVVISGHPTDPTGDQGVLVGATLDSAQLTVSVDPAKHTVATSGAEIRINRGTALYLNQVFPQPVASYDPSSEFAAGDAFGVASVTATVR